MNIYTPMKTKYVTLTILIIIFIIATIIGKSRGQEVFQTTRYQSILACSDQAKVRILYYKPRPDQPYQTFIQIIDGKNSQVYNLSNLYAIKHPVRK